MRAWLTAAAVLAGCADDTSGRGLAVPYETAVPASGNRLAVIGSDYRSSALSLLAADTQVRTGAAIWHSGSAVSAATTALSGDVVLAQTPSLDGRIVVVDRGSAVLSYFDPASRGVTQIPVGTGFYANPQDVVTLSQHKAYAVRMARNPHPTPEPGDLDEGDDLLIVDPTDGVARGRIPLAPFATEPGLVAAASRAVVALGAVWLPLQSLAADFRHQGPARFVAVQPEKDAVVQVVDVPTIKNCVALTRLGDPARLIAVCPGAFSDKAAQGAGAGIVIVHLGDATSQAEIRLRAADFGGAATLGRDVACTVGGVCVVATPGNPDAASRDRIWRFDPGGGLPAEIGLGSGAFTLSGMRAIGARVLIGDRGHGSGDIRVFEVGSAVTSERPSLSSNPGGLGAVDFGVF